MRKNLLLLAGLLLLIPAMMQADNKQTVTIGGNAVEQPVRRLLFDGDNVQLVFNDGSSTTADMGEVTLTFEWSTPTAIDQLTTQGTQEESSALNSVYDLQGRRVGGQTKAGIYLVRQNGKTVKVIKK